MKSDFKTSLEKLTPFYFTVDSTLHINQAGEGILTIAPNCINTHINSVVDINVITIKYQSNLSGLTADTEPVFCTFELHSIVLVGKLLKINKNSNEAFFIGVPIPETYDFVRELKLTGFDFSFLNDIQLTSYFNDRLVIIKDSFKLHTKIAHQRSQIELDLKNYTETINSLNEAVFEIDLQGNFIHVSSQWKGLSGYSNEDVAGTPFYLYIYEFDREEVLKVFYKLISGEENSITDKIRGVTKDGRVLLLNFSAKPLYNNDHVIYGVSGVLQDITESVYTENRLNLILDNINDEIVLTDINHDYVYVSPSVIKNRGYDSQQEFFNIKTSDNLHPEDYNKFLHLFLVEKLTEVNMEYRIRVKDGVYKWHQGNHKIVKDPITGADFLLTISRDISSNKDFQNQIDILTNHVDDEISIFDTDGNYLFASASLLNTKSVKNLDELKQFNAFDTYIPSEKTKLLHSLSKTGYYNSERIFREKDGKYKWHETKLKKYKDELNNINYIISVSRDIEERKRNEQKMELITNNISDEITMFDIEGSYIYASPSAIKNRGFIDEDDFKKVNARDIYENIDVFNNNVEKTKQNGYLTWEGFLRYKDGTYKNYEASGTYLKDNFNDKEYIVTISRNIEQRKKQEEIIQQNYVKEKLLNNQKSDFITTISHEFRTPLAIIKTYVELIHLLETNSSTFTNYIDTINSEVDRMLIMMKDAIMLEKVDDSTLHYELKKEDFGFFLIKLVERINKSGIDERKIQIQFNRKLNMIVLLNEEHLEHAFENIITNALKYSPEKEAPLILVDELDNELKIVVKDFGIGIPEEALKNVFNPFYRAFNTGSIPGSGLGLNIVKKILDKHNACIEIKSILKEGTTVNITMPLA